MNREEMAIILRGIGMTRLELAAKLNVNRELFSRERPLPACVIAYLELAQAFLDTKTQLIEERRKNKVLVESLDRERSRVRRV